MSSESTIDIEVYVYVYVYGIYPFGQHPDSHLLDQIINLPWSPELRIRLFDE